ncbi:MAG: response regulator [Phycisphaerae bacterium]|jgi:PAS domain S-box-containing protein
MHESLRVLLIEDSEADAALILRELRRGEYEVTARRVSTLEELHAALADGGWDVVISDFVLPGFDGLEALRIVRQVAGNVPFLLVSAPISEERAIEAMRAGAHDYLAKDQLARLRPALERELRDSEERRARQRAEAALRESEAQHRAIAETARDAIITADATGVVRFWNAAAERVFGFTSSEVLGRDMLELIVPPQHRKAKRQAMVEFARTGHGRLIGQTIELTALRKDGTEFPIDLSLSSYEGADGPVAVAMIRDVTDRKEKEAQLRRSEQRLQAILDTVQAGIVIEDARTHEIVEANPAALQMIGVTRAEALGRPYHQFTRPADADCGPVADPGHFGDNVERVLLTAGGETLPIIETVTPLVLDDGEFLVDSFVDISDRKRGEEQLRLAKEMAEAADRTKSEFLANMSHEIRTPLTAILGFSEMLSGDVLCCTVCPSHANCPTRSQHRDHAATVAANGQYLLTMINDILDLSKVEAGKLEVERIRVSTCEILAQVASLAQVHVDAKGLSFELEFNGPIPEFVQTDPTRLRQILVNVVGNAIKFTEVGSVRLITRVLDADGPEPALQFEVVDTGIGMTPQQVAGLFQPFGQADTSMTRRFGGTGLGLAICKRLVELLGGEIAIVETKPARGTRAKITIDAGSLANVPMLDNPKSAIITKVTASRAHSGSKYEEGLTCRILLAEDGPDNQRLIAHVLRKSGAEVTIVENGQLAVDAALTARDTGQPFDVVLMDMQMPVMDGYAATRLLRQSGYESPIIALTAYAMAGDRQRCLAAGCNEYATKPICRSQLIQSIRSQLEEHGVHGEVVACHAGV